MEPITINTYCKNLNKDLLPGETLHDIEGYPDYMVTNYGRVFSFKYGKVRVLKQQVSKGRNKDEAIVVFSGKDAKRIIDLVGKAFVGEKTDKQIYYHLNKVLWDNRVENIRIGDRSKSRKLDFEKGRVEYKGHLIESGKATRFDNKYIFIATDKKGEELHFTHLGIKLLFGKHAIRAVDRAIEGTYKTYKGYTWRKELIKKK